MTQTGTASYMMGELPLGTDARSVRRRIEAMEKLLENTFRIPVINQRGNLLTQQPLQARRELVPAFIFMIRIGW